MLPDCVCVQRAMVMPGGKIEARPMMYIALTYDHRLIDGREVSGPGTGVCSEWGPDGGTGIMAGQPPCRAGL